MQHNVAKARCVSDKPYQQIKFENNEPMKHNVAKAKQQDAFSDRRTNHDTI